jgi:ribonuclease R
VAKLAKGVLRAHRDGYGFVRPETPLAGVDGDIFIPPDEAAKAMHGDTVLVRVQRFGSRAEGQISKVLERGLETVVGQVRLRKRGTFVKPFDTRIQHWIEIPEGLEIPPADTNPHRVGYQPKTVESLEDLDGQVVNVRLLDYPDRENDNAVGRIIEILGRQEDFGVDVEIVIRKHQLPHEFPYDVLEEARSVRPPTDADLDGREDFRDLDIITIDGETARDFDDAIHVSRSPEGNWLLQVHIADVSQYVRPGSAIDREAQNRGTSVYFPDRAIPMLPVELSTDICSLRPGVDRLVVSALLEIDNHGETIAARFTKGVIRSAARMTYTEVHRLIDSEDPPAKYLLMRDLALILNKKRTRRGSIDFDLPEALIEFDEFGEMAGVHRGPRNIAHRLIEEFMLAANEAVASHLEQRGVPSVYRIHEPPDPKRVLEFEETAARFGASLGVGAIPVKKHYLVQRTRDGRKIRKDVVLHDDSKPVATSRHYQRLIDKIAGKPTERILSYLMLRSLKQARYSAKNEGHFALAAASYTHFTSPIRRYPDLLVHRVLTESDATGFAELSQLAEDCSFTERRAADAERELVEWKKAKFMIGRLGDTFPGIVISVMKFGFFVELDDIFVEGLVLLETLRGDRFNFDEGRRRIIGARSRREFSIGDRLEVLVARVDAAERRVYFTLPDDRPSRRQRP